MSRFRTRTRRTATVSFVATMWYFTYIIEKPDKSHNEQSPPVVLEDETIRDLDMLHRFPLEFLGLLELETHQKQCNRRNDAQAQANPPSSAEMAFREDEDQDVWHKCTDDKAPVDSHIGEHDEPEVPSSGLQFARCLGGCDTACGIFSSDTNTDKEAICGEGCHHAIERSAAVCAGTQSCKDDHDDCRDDKRIPT